MRINDGEPLLMDVWLSGPAVRHIHTPVQSSLRDIEVSQIIIFMLIV